MTSQGFSIDIDKLPQAEGLGPLVGGITPQAQTSQSSSPLHGAFSASRAGSQRHAANPLSMTSTNSSFGEPVSPSHSQPHALASVLGSGGYPQRSGSPSGGLHSPGRGGLRSGAPSTANASPRHLSPATSQIFERDVQEANVLAAELSQAVPSHLQTDDHIPTVLDQSAEVITDSRVDPADVEIVMHKDHVPAAAVAEAAVSGNSMNDSGFLGSPQAESVSSDSPPLASFPSISAQLAPHPEESITGTPQAQSYGNVNPNDPRRLSFISFADVVHAEHPEREFPYTTPHHPLSQMSTPGYRSPSPSGQGRPSGVNNPPSTNMNKQFASATNLGVGGPGLGDFHSQVRRSSASLASGAGIGRRGSVGLSSLRGDGATSAHVEGGLPHGETRGELMVESMSSAMQHPREL